MRLVHGACLEVSSSGSNCVVNRLVSSYGLLGIEPDSVGFTFFDQGVSQGFVLNHLEDLLTYGFRIIWIAEQGAISRDMVHGVVLTGDDGYPDGLSFQNGHAEAFEVRAEEECGRRGIGGLHLFF